MPPRTVSDRFAQRGRFFAMAQQEEILAEITELKRKKRAVILAHVYQRPEVQDAADFVGDSLELSRKAVDTEAEVIVFCGVQFMAETASILNPDKTVLLPDRSAGCELADMATVEQLRARMAALSQDAAVVSYVNSSAGIKAESDICCTSANAVDVVRSLPERRVLFLPDRNLASFVAEHLDKQILPWQGYCYVHEVNITRETIQELQRQHPQAVVMCHPECTPSVRWLAQYVGSTSQMVKFAARSNASEFIVGTEDGLVHRLRRVSPDKRFYPVGSTCEGMRRITLEKVKASLEQMQFEVRVPDEIRERAKRALDRMLRV